MNRKILTIAMVTLVIDQITKTILENIIKLGTTKQIIKYEHIDQDTVEYHQDELNKIKYIFDITEAGYKLNKITINQ